MLKSRILTHLLIFSLFGFSCFSLFYFTFSRNEMKDYGSYTDVIHYVDMYNGVRLDSIPKQFRYRILTPYTAKIIPLPSGILTKLFDIGSSKKIIHFRFMILNSFFISLTCYFFFLLLIKWNFNFFESLLGGYLFLCSYFVLTWAFMANSDAASYLFLILGLLCIHQKKYSLFGLTLLTGLFFKETTILILIFSLLISSSKKERIYFLISALPGIAAYVIFRFSFNQDFGDIYTLERATNGVVQLFKPGIHHIYFLITCVFSFGTLWIFSSVGLIDIWKNNQQPLKQLSILIPFIIISPFFINAQTIGRIWFLLFPIFIPAGLIGLRKLALFFETTKTS